MFPQSCYARSHSSFEYASCACFLSVLGTPERVDMALDHCVDIPSLCIHRRLVRSAFLSILVTQTSSLIADMAGYSCFSRIPPSNTCLGSNERQHQVARLQGMFDGKAYPCVLDFGHSVTWKLSPNTCVEPVHDMIVYTANISQVTVCYDITDVTSFHVATR
jgi:hypothetical protein